MNNNNNCSSLYAEAKNHPDSEASSWGHLSGLYLFNIDWSRIRNNNLIVKSGSYCSIGIKF